MVSGKRINNLAAEMRTTDFSIISGLSPSIGGENEGPNPHELLEAALAACTITTLQMYRNHKGLGLLETSVVVKIESEGKDGVLISRQISFQTILTAEEKTKLLEIADKCPIHKLLSQAAKIETVMV